MLTADGHLEMRDASGRHRLGLDAWDEIETWRQTG
jgi:hypothetical protein